MIRKSHVMIASLLLMLTIVLSGCVITWHFNPPPKVSIIECIVNGDTFYRNKPAPVPWTMKVQNIADTDGDVNINVTLSWYNTATGTFDEVGVLLPSTTVHILASGSHTESGTWTYTRAAVATTYGLKCSASLVPYSVSTTDFFVIWLSSGAPTGLQKGVLQNMDNAGNTISRAEMYITAYDAAKAQSPPLILGTEIVDLRSLKLGKMTADEAIALAQGKLDSANSARDGAYCAFYGGSCLAENYSGQDYSTAFALSKQSKDDALMAKKIVALVLGQLSLGKGVVLNLV